MIKYRYALLCATLYLAACTLLPPKAERSEYFETRAAGFLADTDTREIRYTLAIDALKDIPEGSVLEVQFENPMGTAPLVTTQSVDPSWASFHFQSPPVHGLKVGKVYRMEVLLYSDASHSQQLAAHHQDVQNLIDQRGLGW
jgi:hypothetical protein